MKRKIVISIIFVIFFLWLLGEAEPTPTKDHTPYDIASLAGKSNISGIAYETDYSNIVAVTEFQSYETDTEKIVCKVINADTDEIFFVHSIPLIEKYISSKWVRLAYYPSNYYWESGRHWLECIESKEIYFYPASLEEKFSKGKYRLVVFIGDTKTYAEFEVTE